MGNYKLALVIILSLSMGFGCSKKKEEAAELEKEMLGKPDTATAVMTQPATDTTPDVAAVPQEPEPSFMGAPAGSGYTVQVAGCEDRAYAEYLVEKYTARGYEPFVTTTTVEGQIYYRVRIGAFATLSEARALKIQLEDRYSVDAWIDYIQ
ncbi:MAG: SPOR domain-containing protein [Candidatus Zixiibacteriota bacterium]